MQPSDSLYFSVKMLTLTKRLPQKLNFSVYISEFLCYYLFDLVLNIVVEKMLSLSLTAVVKRMCIGRYASKFCISKDRIAVSAAQFRSFLPKEVENVKDLFSWKMASITQKLSVEVKIISLLKQWIYYKFYIQNHSFKCIIMYMSFTSSWFCVIMHN